MPEAARVRSMFARIAGRYDLLNHLLSAGIDRRWRRRAVARAGALASGTVIDACCGTGDLGLEFARRGATVIGVDFTPEMLVHALPKQERSGAHALFAHGDALSLPVRDGAADVACVGFGIRNVADRTRGLAELARVVRPGGRVLVLEFTQPPGPVFGGLYRFYFTKLLPTVGNFVSRDDDAYSYLARTVMAWPSPDALRGELEDAGLVDCGYELLTRGIACLHWGTRPAR
ncbi:MAG: ubiquinone/menaquinone biosynthesis methyltransferase [Planctomycetes bacterium]|nr:ubiquinone/menaquinone biosynthesis methyltransferase [Planctomycetota bacterium]